MPTIPANKIPLVTPGQLFSQLTTNDAFAIRWITADDPVYFEAANRPIADAIVQGWVLARSLDQVALRISHQNLFPFLVQAQVENGLITTNLPISWIWDMHVSMPAKWENVRLAKIKRVSGANATDYTGKLRLVFMANEEGSTTEVAIFQADYAIDGTTAGLTYQKVRVSIPTASEESNPIPTGESQTIDGFITFRTLDPVTDATVSDFLDTVPPPVSTTDANSDGEYDTPAEYELADEPAGSSSVTNDYTLTGLSHGTGLLVDSATNALSPVDSDIANFIAALNFPFDATSTLQSVSHPGIIIPVGLFNEFNVVAPAGDEPTGDTSGEFFPVWISKIVRDDAATVDTFQIRLSTYNVESPSTSSVEFAQLTLQRDFDSGRIVTVTPLVHLFPAQDVGDENWMQGFGKGHVVLSSKWGSTTDEVNNFFDAIAAVTDDPPEVLFSKATTRVGSWGVSRVSQHAPTKGQSAALHGTLGDTTPPTATNRFVVESDQGAGTTVDFETSTDLAAEIRVNADIERYGYTGSLVHKAFKLVVNSDGVEHDYDTDILPRIELLLGRSPIMFDEWFDGTVKKFYDGDKWIG